MRELSTKHPRASSLRLTTKAGIYRLRLFQIMDGRRRRGEEGGGGITCSSEAIVAGGGEERMEGYANRAQLSQAGLKGKKKEGRREGRYQMKGKRKWRQQGTPEREREQRREKKRHPSIQSNLWTDLLLVVNRILFRFGFGRKFRPKYVSVSAFRLSPFSALRPKHVFRPKEAVSAEMTVSAKRGFLVNH